MLAPHELVVHRHQVVPLIVVLFFFICPAQTGHLGRFVFMGIYETVCFSISVGDVVDFPICGR